jgi:hypothetical protein
LTSAIAQQATSEVIEQGPLVPIAEVSQPPVFVHHLSASAVPSMSLPPSCSQPTESSFITTEHPSRLSPDPLEYYISQPGDSDAGDEPLLEPSSASHSEGASPNVLFQTVLEGAAGDKFDGGDKPYPSPKPATLRRRTYKGVSSSKKASKSTTKDNPFSAEARPTTPSPSLLDQATRESPDKGHPRSRNAGRGKVTMALRVEVQAVATKFYDKIKELGEHFGVLESTLLRMALTLPTLTRKRGANAWNMYMRLSKLKGKVPHGYGTPGLYSQVL